MKNIAYMPFTKVSLFDKNYQSLTLYVGTGKTHCIRQITLNLRKQNKRVAIVCTTGMATMQYKDLGAKTIHSWAGLYDGRYGNQQLVDLIGTGEKFKECKQRILATEVLVIDEISMLSQKTLEQLEFVCRKTKKNEVVFGGIQVIGGGSFKQLPPVPNLNYGDNGNYCFQSKLWDTIFPHRIHLTTVIRQHEVQLIKAVNELEDGMASPETQDFLKTLDRPLAAGCEAVKLFATNIDVNLYNMDRLSEHPGESTHYRAVDTGIH